MSDGSTRKELFRHEEGVIQARGRSYSGTSKELFRHEQGVIQVRDDQRIMIFRIERVDFQDSPLFKVSFFLQLNQGRIACNFSSPVERSTPV